MTSQKEIDELAQRVVNEDVLVCLSSMVHELNTHYDAVALLRLEDEFRDLAGKHDHKGAIEAHLSKLPPEDLDEILEQRDLRHLLNDSDATKIEAIVEDLELSSQMDDFCDDHDIEPDYWEAYEHWAVSGWLGGHLRAQGEIVVELFNMNVWARTTTGQMIYMDGVLQRIARNLLS